MIDFRCTQCGKLLRAPDDAVGKQAKCPACGNIQPIAADGGAAAGANPFAGGPVAGGPPPVPGAGNPFATGPAAPGAPSSDNPYAAPAYDPRVGTFAAGATPYAPTRISVGEVLSSAWTIFTNNLGNLLALGAMFVALFGLFYALIASMVFGMIGVGGGNANQVGAIFAGVVVVGIVGGIAALWLSLGAISYVIKIARGQPVTFGEVFSAARFLPTAIGAYLLMMLISFGATFVVLIPIGMIGALAANNEAVSAIAGLVGQLLNFGLSMLISIVMAFVFPFIVDRDAGVMEAIRGSFELATRNFLSLIVIWIVLVVVTIAGIIPCGLGLFFAVPYAFLAWIVSYLRASGQRTAVDLAYNPAA